MQSSPNTSSSSNTCTSSPPVQANSPVESRVASAPTVSDQKSPPANQTTANASNGFEELFKVFAKFGDHKSVGDCMTLSNSDKWFKQAKVIDGKRVTTVDTGIYFKQIAKTKKSLTLQEYNQFLESIAKNKKIDLQEIKNKLSSSGPPSTTKTTTAVTSGAVGRLTDHTKYTGSHKQRFDQTGKGRGRAGREEVTNSSGYVTGFKDEVNANKH